MGFERPLPMPNEDSEPYWLAAAKRRLAIPRCKSCRHWFLPPAALCPVCWSGEVVFEDASGKARVYSFIVVHRPQHPAFSEDAPYNVAIVELDEGPLMHTRIAGIPADRLEIGMRVRAVFQKADDDITLPMFERE